MTAGWRAALAGLLLAGVSIPAQATEQGWKAQRMAGDDGIVTYRLQSPASISNPLHLAVLWDESCTPYAILLAARTGTLVRKGREDVIPARVDFTMQDGTSIGVDVAFSEPRAQGWVTLSLYPYPEELETLLRAASETEALAVTVWGDDESLLLDGGVPIQRLRDARYKIEERCMQDRLARE